MSKKGKGRRGRERPALVEVTKERWRRLIVTGICSAAQAPLMRVTAQGNQFFRSPRPGEGETFGNWLRKTRKAFEEWVGRNVSVPGGSGRRQQGLDELGSATSHGVCESDHAGQPSRRRFRSPKPKGGSDPGVSHRPPVGWFIGSPGRPFNAEAESLREGHAGAKLAVSQTPGAHQSSVRIAHQYRRTGDGKQDRVEDDEAQECNDEGKDRQIGRRRRRRRTKGSLRDACREKSQQEPKERRSRSVPARAAGDSGGEGEEGRARRRRRQRSEERIEAVDKSPARRVVVEEKEEEGSAVLEKEEEGRRRESERSVKSGLTRFREESNPPAISEEGSAAEVEADDVEEVLVRYRKWLQENDVAGLTVAQMGAYMVLQLKKSSTNLGKYLLRMVTEPPGEEGQERQRSVLPLPLIPDSAKELKKVWDGEEYRRLMGSWSEKKKMNPGQVQRGMRRSGLLIWHGLLVAGINYLWSGCRWTSRICSRKPSQAQQGCLDRLWKTARLFVDDVSEVKEKLVKSPGAADWKDKLEGVRISYQGEIVEKAQELTLEQILPGLPPVGYGGRVSITDLCEGEVRECLLDPSRVLLEGEELPELLPTLKVMASDEEWGKICRVLMERGLIRPVDEVAKLGDQYVENGAFGVVKPHKKTESGKDVLRLIMDFRPCNAVTRIIEGDVRSLAGAPSLQHIVLPQGTVLRVSAEDLVAAFYLFALPPEWSKLMAFQKKVAWKDLGFEKPGTTRVGACVLPMGWASAVGVLQHAHRRLALASPLRGAGLLGELEIKRDAEFPELETDGGAGWSLYLDDTSILEIFSERVAKEMDGKSPAEQDRLRRAYTHWGIPYSVDKALTCSVCWKVGSCDWWWCRPAPCFDSQGFGGDLLGSTAVLKGVSCEEVGPGLCRKASPHSPVSTAAFLHLWSAVERNWRRWGNGENDQRNHWGGSFSWLSGRYEVHGPSSWTKWSCYSIRRLRDRRWNGLCQPAQCPRVIWCDCPGREAWKRSGGPDWEWSWWSGGGSGLLCGDRGAFSSPWFSQSAGGPPSRGGKGSGLQAPSPKKVAILHVGPWHHEVHKETVGAGIEKSTWSDRDHCGWGIALPGDLETVIPTASFVRSSIHPVLWHGWKIYMAPGALFGDECLVP